MNKEITPAEMAEKLGVYGELIQMMYDEEQFTVNIGEGFSCNAKKVLDFIKMCSEMTGYDVIEKMSNDENRCTLILKPQKPDFSEIRKNILATVQDLVSDFTYYDRKEDEDLSADQLKEAVKNKVITIGEMVDEFRDHLINSLANE